MEIAPGSTGATVRNSLYRSQRAISDKHDTPESYNDLIALKLRLDQLENENLALKTQVNQLIMSLSKTLLRGAVKS